MISCVFLSSIGVRPIVVGGGGGAREAAAPQLRNLCRSSGKARMIRAKTLERKHYKIMLLAAFPFCYILDLHFIELHFRFNSD